MKYLHFILFSSLLAACANLKDQVSTRKVVRDSSAEVVEQIAEPKTHTNAKVADQVATQAHHATDHKVTVDNSKDALMQLHSLMLGNSNFVRGANKHPAQDINLRKQLASGQQPGSIVLSCSDSRVPPEIVFDKGLGELFVVRSAGEVADSAAIASMEYAIEHLGAKLLVVMGHTSCGAVKAALTTDKGKSAGSVDLDRLVAMIKPHLDPKSDPKDKELINPVKENVNHIADSLSKKSKIIEHALVTKQIMIVRALYHLDSGQVDFWF